MAGKESGGSREVHIHLPSRWQMAIAIALLSVGLTAANKSLAGGIEFQIPFTDVHATLAAAIGEKDRLTEPFPASIASKMGPNANKSDIFDFDPGINVGNVGAFFEADVRHAPGDPILNGGIGTSR